MAVCRRIPARGNGEPMRSGRSILKSSEAIPWQTALKIAGWATGASWASMRARRCFQARTTRTCRSFQTPDHVVLFNEMIHNSRIIPLDGPPHITARQWSGDSRGRWDGDTLVVETINFSGETSLNGSSPSMHLVERFTRVNDEMVTYAVTVENPDTWTRPWTAEIPLMQLDDQVPRIYEYACHEGNYSLDTVLRGARLEELAAEAGR